MLGTAYSIWFVGLCLLLGLAYAMLLYFKSKEQFPLWLKRTAFGCRAAAVALISFLLLRPTVETKVKEVEKPIILIGADNSESIVMGKDSSYYRGEYTLHLQSFVNRLSKDYQVDVYLIGDSVQATNSSEIPNTFSGKSSPISSFFKQMSEQYIHRNVGAMVLLSDGIYTEGSNPLYEAESWKVPIYTVALGDTSLRKDAWIAKTNFNKTVFKHNFFPLEILVQAHQLGGEKTALVVLKDGKKVFEKQIVYQGAHSEWIRLNLEASESGYLHYQVLLEGVDGELTLANNRSDVVVQVLEERKQVAIVYSTPHPDVAALTAALKDNSQYQLDCYSVSAFHPGEKTCDLLVLHQLPNVQQPIRPLLEYAEKSGVPILYFTGDMSQMRLDNLPSGFRIQATKNMLNDAYPSFNRDFNDFNLPADMELVLAQMPPLQIPYGNYSLPNASRVCIYQKINNIVTNYPLLFLHESEGRKNVVCLGEGWWRWRMYDYLWNGNHDFFDALVSQIFQYLMVKEDKSFFRVKTQHLFTENEPVLFDAELYNKNYELNNSPEVNLTLYELSDSKEKYNYVFSRNFQSYHLDVGRLKPGDYQWDASVEVGNETYSRNGRFCVQQLQVEALDLTANHQLLQNIADLNDAKMFYTNQLDSLEKYIRQNAQIKSVAKYSKKRHPLFCNWYYFLLIILLMGGEWLLRKWSGNY